MKTRYWNSRLRAMEAYTPGFQPPLTPTTIKLNTNENPWPPSPQALKAIRDAVGNGLRLYPPSTWSELRSELATVYDIPEKMIFCGNGSDEILSLIFRCFIDPGEKLLLPYPTYSLYPVLASAAGVELEQVETRDDFSLDLTTMARHKARLAIVANPNAPTGILTPLAELLEFADQFEGIVVIDEAYIDFSPQGSSCLSALPNHKNIIILRTFSKAFSLCGIRCGYAFADPDLIQGLITMKDSYNLDLLAQRGALAAIRDLAWMQSNVQRIIEVRERFRSTLAALGFTILASATNFLFAKHARLEAEEIFTYLAEQDIHVRHFKGRRVSDWLRISIGTEAEMNKVSSVLAKLIEAR